MPILSVIIPTHERFRYAKETVAAILEMHEEIELIVSDTSEVDPWTSAAPHPRLKVVRTGTGISVVDNFRSEEHTSELQSLMRSSYAVLCLKTKQQPHQQTDNN